MIQAMKLIKIFGIALAVLLIASIMYYILEVVNLFSFKSDDKLEFVTTSVKQEINTLNIDLAATKLSIKKGNELKVASNNKYITIIEDNGELKIKEKTKITNNNLNYELIVEIPDDYNLENVNVNAGAGKVDIEKLSVNNLDFDLGAGKVSIEELIVNNKSSIDAGAGELSIKSCIFNNLDFDMGIGSTTINGKILGASEIDAGVGSLDINLEDDLSNYKLIVDKGVGSISLNNKKIKDGTYGSGNNIIEISGGVGSIQIKTR